MDFLKNVTLTIFASCSMVWADIALADPVPSTDLSDVPTNSFTGEEFCFDPIVITTGGIEYGLSYLRNDLAISYSLEGIKIC